MLSAALYLSLSLSFPWVYLLKRIMRSPFEWCKCVRADRSADVVVSRPEVKQQHQLTTLLSAQSAIARIIFRSNDFSSVLRLIYYSLFIVHLLTRAHTHTRLRSILFSWFFEFGFIGAMRALARPTSNSETKTLKKNKETLHSLTIASCEVKEWNKRTNSHTDRLHRMRRLYSAIKSLALHRGASFAWYNRFQIAAFHEITVHTHTHTVCPGAMPNLCARCVCSSALLMLNVWVSARARARDAISGESVCASRAHFARKSIVWSAWFDDCLLSISCFSNTKFIRFAAIYEKKPKEETKKKKKKNRNLSGRCSIDANICDRRTSRIRRMSNERKVWKTKIPANRQFFYFRRKNIYYIVKCVPTTSIQRVKVYAGNLGRRVSTHINLFPCMSSVDRTVHHNALAQRRHRAHVHFTSVGRARAQQRKRIRRLFVKWVCAFCCIAFVFVWFSLLLNRQFKFIIKLC